MISLDALRPPSAANDRSSAMRFVQLLYSTIPLTAFALTGSWVALLIAMYMIHRAVRPRANRWPR